MEEAQDTTDLERRAPVRRILRLFHGLHGLDFVAYGRRGRTEIARHFGGQLSIQGLVDGHEDSAIHQFLHHQIGLHVELLGELLHCDAFADGNLAADRRRTGFHMPALRPQDLFFLGALALLADRTAVAGTSA